MAFLLEVLASHSQKHISFFFFWPDLGRLVVLAGGFWELQSIKVTFLIQEDTLYAWRSEPDLSHRNVVDLKSGSERIIFSVYAGSNCN